MTSLKVKRIIPFTFHSSIPASTLINIDLLCMSTTTRSDATDQDRSRKNLVHDHPVRADSLVDATFTAPRVGASAWIDQ